jgi:hypothetical protein
VFDSFPDSRSNLPFSIKILCLDKIESFLLFNPGQSYAGVLEDFISSISSGDKGDPCFNFHGSYPFNKYIIMYRKDSKSSAFP